MRRTREQALDIHIAILEGVAAGERLMDIRARLGVTKEAFNDDMLRLKKAGYLAGDGRSSSLRVLKMLERGDPPPPHIAKTSAPRENGNAARTQRRALEANGSDAGDPGVFALLKELADPRGLRIIALFEPEAVSRALRAGYVRREDEVALELTDAGRAALGLPVVATPSARVPVKAASGTGATDRLALLRLAQRLAATLAATLAELCEGT